MAILFEKIDDCVERKAPKQLNLQTSVRAGVYGQFGKRLFDIVLVVLSLPFVLPVIALIALMIARDGHAPFYSSARVGRGGRVFRMLKLRTMVPNADCLLERHLDSNPDARQEWESTQKLKCDPRITPFGRFLRKSSLDELPQIWNVLKGDMSLVGPRPMLPEQKGKYPGFAYYLLRPGITGSWQVSDRNETAFAKRAEYDQDYERKLSMLTDIRLIFRTIGVVFRGTGY